LAKDVAHPLYLVGIDGSPSGDKALRYAIELAAARGARLRVVTVTDISMTRASALVGAGFQFVVPSAEEAAREALGDAREALESAESKSSCAVLPLADPAHGLVHEAVKCGAGLIIVGSHGRRGLARALLGSVAEKVVREAPCPVLVVR
jgi:nucleotide-binding universal stress UspA family protein